MAKLTVTTDIGTFTRKTDRTYTHIVVVKGYRAERLEQSRLNALREEQEQLARHEAVLAEGRDTDYPEHYAEWLADGHYTKWAQAAREAIAALEARGVITEDGNSWGDYGRYATSGAPATWQLLGWCGRLDLARKLAAGKTADVFRDVRIYALDGTRVR